MPTNVLFLCPHSAGRSVFAATYFRAAAARLGVDAAAAIAGTDPGDGIMPDVRAAVEAQGFAIPDEPRLVDPADIDRADIVVSIGCDHGDVPTDDLVEWDVPMLSADFSGSMNAIFERAESLALSLSTGSSPS